MTASIVPTNRAAKRHVKIARESHPQHNHNVLGVEFYTVCMSWFVIPTDEYRLLGRTFTHDREHM